MSISYRILDVLKFQVEFGLSANLKLAQIIISAVVFDYINVAGIFR